MLYTGTIQKLTYGTRNNRDYAIYAFAGTDVSRREEREIFFLFFEPLFQANRMTESMTTNTSKDSDFREIASKKIRFLNRNVLA